MKHAYLIVIHNNFDQFEKLIKLLDDERFDLYVHVDKKVKDFDFKRFNNVLKKSKLYFSNKRISVNWGGYSIANAMFNLLQTASQNNYAYYHLVSGADLPLKSNDYIYDFFKENCGKEFVSFDENWDYNRVFKIDLLTENHKSYKFRHKLIRLLNNQLYKFQVKFNYDRMKKFKLKIMKGANWFSITHDFAKHVLSNRKLSYKMFKYTINADENVLQTILYNSLFNEKIYSAGTMRFIDWNRGNGNSPYTFKIDDYDILINSNKLWARKFDENIDGEIVDKICDYLSNLNGK